MLRVLFLIALFATGVTVVHAQNAPKATLYKSPQCTCCEGYAAYLRENGFAVDVRPTNDLTEISRKAGVPERLQGCHTMFVDGYVIDGHVPVNVVRKVLSEKPAIAGVTLPGMQIGPSLDTQQNRTTFNRAATPCD